jgi:hypothetical protein
VTRGEGKHLSSTVVVDGRAMHRGGRRKRTPTMRLGAEEEQGHGDK